MDLLRNMHHLSTDIIALTVGADDFRMLHIDQIHS